MAEAVKLHREGCLPDAQKKYEAVLQQNPHNFAAMHNLGMVLLGQGRLKPGVDLIETVLAENISFAEKADTFREVGLTLYGANYWEAARPWLQKAVQYYPFEADIVTKLERIAPRGYLKPEVFDPLAGEILKRYTPREAQNYVYVIDIMGTCNLRCPTCPVGNSKDAKRKKGKMPLQLFNKILAKIALEKTSDIAEIWLFNWGEPLLHPELPKFIKKIHEYGYICQLSTNLNIETGLESLLRVNPDVLKISLSGFSEKTYSQTHRGGNIHLVKSNLYRLRYFLDKTKATTRIWLGHHLYKSTVQEADLVRKMCHELNFQYQPIQAFYQPLEKLLSLCRARADSESETILNDLLMHPIKNIVHIQAHRSGNFDCELRFNQTVINHDGSVALCCGVYEDENMLGVQFLDKSLPEIESLKYSHPFCLDCRSTGLDYSVSELPDRLYNE